MLQVLYIGKIKVSHKKVPDSFIDDALEKFRVHELEKGKTKGVIRQGSSQNISTGSNGQLIQMPLPNNNVVSCKEEEETSRRGSEVNKLLFFI